MSKRRKGRHNDAAFHSNRDWKTIGKAIKQASLDRDILKAQKALNAEVDKQMDIIIPAMVIILWRDYGWRYQRITKRINAAVKIWTDCMNTRSTKSPLNLLEEETGIEMMLDGAQSYHEFPFLDLTTWDGQPLDDEPYLAMLKTQKQWLATLLTTNIMLTLHREDKWGFERLSRFNDRLNGIRMQYGENPQNYSAEMERLTGISTQELWRHDNANARAM